MQLMRIDTKVKEVEDAFVALSKRDDIGIIIINQCVRLSTER